MKKILTLLLVFAIITTCGVFSASAEENAAPDDFKFICELGLLDAENVSHSEYLKRIQLAEMIFNIVVDDNISFENSGIKCKFADVPEEKSHIVEFIYNMGIMKGCSEYIFDPDGYVTYNQVIKTIVSLLGYEIKAQYFGGYPSGYLTQAAAIGLMKNDGVSGDSIATIGGVASLFKRAINVDFATQNGDEFEIHEGVSYLEYYMGIKHAIGIVTGNYLTNISDSRGTSYFGIYIDNDFMFVEKSAGGIQNCLGYKVDYFYRSLNGEQYIFYYEEDRNSILKISVSDIESADSLKITFFTDEKTEIASLSASMALIYNGTYLPSYTKDDLNPFRDGKNDGEIVLVDNSGDKIYDIAVVSVCETHVAKEVTEDKIYSYYSPQNPIDISKYEERNIDIANILGEPLTPDTIREGHILNVFKDKSGNIRRIIVTTDHASGEINEIEKSGDRILSMVIDGVRYEVSPRLDIHDTNNRLSPGGQVNVYFNYLAKISHIDVDKTFNSGLNIAYLVDGHEEGTFKKEVTIMYFKPEGEMVISRLEEKVRINGKICDATDVFTHAGLGEDQRIKRQVFMYKENPKTKNINVIEFAAVLDKDKPEYIDGFYKFPENEAAYYPKIRSFGGYLSVDRGRGGTIFFSVPDEANKDDYDSYSVLTKPYEGSTLQNCEAYGTSKLGLIADVLVCYVDSSEQEMETYSPIFIVEKIVLSDGKDGEVLTKVTGNYVEGSSYAEGEFFVETEKIKTAFSGKMPKPGDVFRVNSFAKSGKATTFIPVFEYKDKICHFDSPVGVSIGESIDRYAYGKVIDAMNGTVRIKIDGTEVYEVHSLYGDASKVMEAMTDRDGNVISVTSSTPLSAIDETTHPGEGSDILIFSRGGTTWAIFIYN